MLRVHTGAELSSWTTTYGKGTEQQKMAWNAACYCFVPFPSFVGRFAFRFAFRFAALEIWGIYKMLNFLIKCYLLVSHIVSKVTQLRFVFRQKRKHIIEYHQFTQTLVIKPTMGQFCIELGISILMFCFFFCFQGKYLKVFIVHSFSFCLGNCQDGLMIAFLAKQTVTTQ